MYLSNVISQGKGIISICLSINIKNSTKKLSIQQTSLEIFDWGHVT
jgi:hypothetical protein